VPVFWHGTDRLEQDDDFCIACHLTPGTPLHIALREDFDRVPAVSLAAAHRATSVDGRPLRCIDCHGGASIQGRVRVKALAAADALWYLAGHFEEPDEMRWPLWDEDCTACHRQFQGPTSEAWETPHFHELEVHNVDLGIACVECHESHGVDGDSSTHFLEAETLRIQCVRCHPEFGAEGMALPIR